MNCSPSVRFLYDGHRGDPEGIQVVLTPDLTLSQFYELWMLPVLLEAQNDVGQNTKLIYKDALGWWKTIVGDPACSQVDEWAWSQFVRGLRDSRYRRGPTSPERALSPSTQRKHQKAIRAIITRAERKQLIQPFDYVIRTVVNYQFSRFLL